MGTSAHFSTFTAWYARLSWWRLVAARRIAATLLLLLAAGLAVRAQLHPGELPVVVAAHDLKPGAALLPADLGIRRLPPDQVPEGAATAAEQLVGRTVAGPVRTGETLTDARVIAPRLAQLATSVPEARIVPVRLPDQALADMLRPGDVVDVITVPQRQSGLPEDATTKQTGLRPPEVLARGAVVLLVSEPERSRSPEGRVALIAMADKPAQTVAAATLVQPVTVILR
ncbi:SAF domain-containing protein [Segniliparus rugosus]|uniref:Flp pilus assembly protein CpaB n=1 Tax=Segniliparus rugosus (strain ATCC BAA-974 / DSM 45345 / CCUG 50838 / CIP 108380 / JCM 13579 / CDC 945) TaxID=679197 RepID=E5XN96_SEGRC|nr:SAF domain-containing protein [Segniliparus rugosus]EFV14192.1 flp pilus assembly protein CpaB [Segniliparus rugosus ATCC BAA-974]